MKLQIERKYVEAMVNEFPGLATLKDQLRFGNKAEVTFKQLSNAELRFLLVLYKLVDSFPEATGRVIKGLSKLVAKFCQHKKNFTDFEGIQALLNISGNGYGEICRKCTKSGHSERINA